MGQRTIVHVAASTIAKDFLYWNLYPWDYQRELSNPVDTRKVVFLEGRKNAMPDDFRLLWEAFERRGGFNLQFITLNRHNVSFLRYVKNCREAVREMANARVIFLSDASDLVSCLPLRPGTKVIQLWHACGAFKKWGMSTADLLFGGSGFEKKRHPFYENLSLVTVSSPEVEWAYREAMALKRHPEIVQPLGVSRTDVFFREEFLEAARNAIHGAFPCIGERKIILYAPTFRGTTGHAKGPDWLDVSMMKESLDGDYALLIKHHPYVMNPPEIPDSCKDFAFDAGSCRIDQLLIAADVCITDYSSIVFEYSLLGKPMLFFAPDKDDYDDWRGFYYDYDQLTPGPVFTETSQVIDWVKRVESSFSPEEMETFRQKYMCACDGHATDRILDASLVSI